jgi:hypothetical protein
MKIAVQLFHRFRDHCREDKGLEKKREKGGYKSPWTI